jgi:hypothetical protein
VANVTGVVATLNNRNPSVKTPPRTVGAAAVSGNTDTVAVAEPKTAVVVEPAAMVDHAVADDNSLDSAALLAVIRDMLDDLAGMIAKLEAQARLSEQDQDHSQHSFYSQLAGVFEEFRNGLATALSAPQV